MFRGLIRVARPARTATVRSFAEKPKLRLYGPSAVYSQAFFEQVAEDKADYEKISENLKHWNDTLKQDDQLRIFVEDATVTEELRTETVAEIVKVAEYEPLTGELIEALMQTRASHHMPAIAVAFQQLVAHHYGVMKAVITSAEPLTDTQSKAIRDKLVKLAPADASLTIEEKVDPSLIGGLKVEMGEKFQDLSISAAIGACERALRAA